MKISILIFIVSVMFVSCQADANLNFETSTDRCEIQMDGDGKVYGTVFGNGGDITGTFSLERTEGMSGYMDWNGKRLVSGIPVIISVDGEVSDVHIRQVLDSLNLQDKIPEIDIMNEIEKLKQGELFPVSDILEKLHLK